MKTRRLILIFCILIVIFGAGYAALKLTGMNTPQLPDDTAEIPSPADAQRIEIDTGSEIFTLLRTDGLWSLVQDENFPLDTVVCDNLRGALTALTAMRTVDGGDRSAFGFDTPQGTMTAIDTDGTQYHYILGNYNAYNDLYYFSANDAVFMIDSQTAQYFLYNTLDLVEEDAAPEIDEADVSQLRVRSESGTWHYTLTRTDDAYNATGSLVNSGEPDAVYAIDPNAALRLIRSFTMLYFFDCVAYNADADTLAQYGLSSPTAEVYIEYTVKNADGEAESLPFAMYFGAQTDDYIYARMEGSAMIFTVHASEAAQFLSPDFDAIRTE